MKYALWIIVALVFIISCEDKESSELKTGDLVVESMVTLGNSLTAGVEHGGWKKESAAYSYANLIAKQIYGAEGIGDGSSEDHVFVYPHVNSPGFPIPTSIENYAKVGTYSDGTDVLAWTLGGGGIDIGSLTAANSSYEESFNNLGIPGAVLRDIVDEESGFNAENSSPPLGNPLFGTVLRARGTATAQALAKMPTFAILWAGNNEVLGSALSGGTNPVYPFDDTETKKGFSTYFSETVNSFLDIGTKMVVVTIPNVTSIPAVRQIGVETSDGSLGFIVDIDGDAVFSDTLAFWGSDDDVTRKLTSNEAVIFGWFSQSVNGQQARGLSESNPLRDNEWLSASEISTIAATVNQYNTLIRNTAASSENIVLVDVNMLFDQIVANGNRYEDPNSDYVASTRVPYGGMFSFDATHPSASGYALIANYFIEQINAGFGAEIEPINVADYIVNAPTPSTAKLGLGQIPFGDGKAFEQSLKIIQGSLE